MFDIDFHPKQYTAAELADYLRKINPNVAELQELGAALYVEGETGADLEKLAEHLRFILQPHEVAQLVSILEEAKTQRQSGMESKHEKWVLATLNFLTGMDIPFYNRDKYGQRLRGDAGEKEIPERLNLLRDKILEAGVNERKALKRAYDAEDKVEVLQRQIAGYQSLLARLGEQIIEVAPEALERFKPQAAATPEPPASPLPDRADS